MARSARGPLTATGELRNPEDKSLLACLALGYGTQAYCTHLREPEFAARRALEQLIKSLPYATNKYELLVWTFSRNWMIDMEHEGIRYSRQGYDRWLAVVGKIAVGFTADQRDFLIECLTKHTQSLQSIWSHSERDDLVRDILATAGLEPGGWHTFCIIITAAAWAGVLRLPGDNPQPPAAEGAS